MIRHALFAATALAALSLAGCMPAGSKDPWVGFGPNPPLPKPQGALIPTVGIP